MDPRTKEIIDDIKKLRADGDTEMLEAMKDYWDGFADCAKTIFEVLNTLQNGMIEPVKEALKEKNDETEV